MALPVPPGRTGRVWLRGRLELAARGAELLDRKRQALLGHQRRLALERAAAERAWVKAARDAERWIDRATVLDGDERIRLVVEYVRGQAEVAVAQGNLMGIRHPVQANVTIPPTPPVGALGGSSALVCGARAYGAAVSAAARYAAARASEERVSAELGRVLRRLRAIERRWIPRYERAAAALDLALDEAERDEAVRIRWLAQHEEPRGLGPATFRADTKRTGRDPEGPLRSQD